MRTFTLLAVSGISLCAAPAIEAQEEVQESKSKWTFGVKAGINVTSFDVNNTYSNTYNSGGYGYGEYGYNSSANADQRIGINIGGTVEYDLGKRFFLGSGLEFTSKGADHGGYSLTTGIDHQEVYTVWKDSRTLNYLQLPLTIGYRLPVAKDLNLTFSAGGYFGVNVYGKGSLEKAVMTKDIDGKINNDFTGSSSSKTGDTDYGLLGGIGVEYKKFSINANYELGLRNLYTAEPSNMPSRDTWKNRNLTFSLGYKF